MIMYNIKNLSNFITIKRNQRREREREREIHKLYVKQRYKDIYNDDDGEEYDKKNNFQWEMASMMEWGDWEARRTPPAGWNEEQARAKAKYV